MGVEHPFHTKHPIIVKSARSAFECKRNVNYVDLDWCDVKGFVHWSQIVPLIQNLRPFNHIAKITVVFPYRLYGAPLLPNTQCAVTVHGAVSEVKGGDYSWGSKLLLHCQPCLSTLLCNCAVPVWEKEECCGSQNSSQQPCNADPITSYSTSFPGSTFRLATAGKAPIIMMAPPHQCSMNNRVGFQEKQRCYWWH